MYLFKKPHTLIKGETFIERHICKLKKNMGINLKAKFLRYANSSWWWNLEGINYIKGIKRINEILQALVDFIEISCRKYY